MDWQNRATLKMHGPIFQKLVFGFIGRMVWVCGNVCKRLPQFWSKRREMHKKIGKKPEEGSKLSSKSVNGLRQKVQKTGIFLAVLVLEEYLAHAQRVAQI